MPEKITRREFVVSSSVTAAALGIGMPAFANKGTATKTNPIAKPVLPYTLNALAPYISEKTVSVHFNRHHMAYYDLVKGLIDSRLNDYRGFGLEQVIIKSKGSINKEETLHQMAILLYNHNLYWQSMKPNGGGRPSERFLGKIDGSFGGYDSFRKEFLDKAMAIGSGWVTLVRSGETLRLVRTDYHDSPLLKGDTPLLTLDVWEHAYYLDYLDDRKKYVDAFLDYLINWEHGESKLKWS